MSQAALFQLPSTPAKKPPMDDWLKAQLEEKTGGFRAARWGRCQDCQEITLHGMDADLAAGMVTADPTPLSPQQEHACMITGRPTFTIKPRGNSYELNDRSGAYLYGARPPDHRSHTIIPTHKCGARFPGFIKRTTQSQETTHDNPPF